MSSIPLKPLTEHALGVLWRISRDPCPRQEVNPGVRDRFYREELVEEILKPSPYKTVKGKVVYLQITEAGLKRLEESRKC